MLDHTCVVVSVQDHNKRRQKCQKGGVKNSKIKERAANTSKD